MILARYKIFNTKNISKSFILTCVILLLTLITSFNTSSILTFYIAFEASLIPTIALIMLWGYQPERLQARIYLIIYTVTASLPLLLIIIKIKSNRHLLEEISIPERFSIFIYGRPAI